MKIRNGFVSNSSSSSFIIGVAEVTDVDKLKKYAEDNNLNLEENMSLTTYKEFREKDRREWELEKIKGNQIIVESFSYDRVYINTEKLKDDTQILVYIFFGNEGDSYFYEDNDSDYDNELNYDIDYDFFNEEQKKEFDIFTFPEYAGLNKNNSDISYGAQRNG